MEIWLEIIDIRVALKDILVEILKLHPFSRLDESFANLPINQTLHFLLNMGWGVLNPRQNRGNVVPLDYFFDIVSAGLSFIEEYVNFIHLPKEVVKITHDVLIGPRQEKSDIVGLIILKGMEL